MNSLKTIAKLATLVVIGGGTIGAAVGITQAQSFHDAPLSVEAANPDFKYDASIDKGNVRIWFAYTHDNSFDDLMAVSRLYIRKTVDKELTKKFIDVRGSNNKHYNSCEQINGKWRPYQYFDVPAEYFDGTWDCSLQGLQDINGQDVYKKETETFKLDYNHAMYLNNVKDNWGWDGSKKATVETIKTTDNVRYDAVFGAKSLEALYTCSPSYLNGYNAFKEVTDRFIHYSNGVDWKTNGNLDSYTYKDYPDAVDHDYNATYQGEKTRDIDMYAKYLAVQKAYNDEHGIKPTLDVSFINNTAIVATSVTILATSLIAGFAYLLKKRKANA